MIHDGLAISGKWCCRANYRLRTGRLARLNPPPTRTSAAARASPMTVRSEAPPVVGMVWVHAAAAACHSLHIDTGHSNQLRFAAREAHGEYGVNIARIKLHARHGKNNRR